MTWTSGKDLRAQLQRLWERGELLRDVVSGNPRFPLRLSLKKSPASADITQHFDAVRVWVAELASERAVRIEWQDIHHRVQGLQKMPASVWVDRVQDALNCLGKCREWERFAAQVATTRQTHPRLLPWLEKRPLQALELYAEWPRLLAVVDWLLEHPRPGIYLRQVDLPGVHSKFIETHRGALTGLLDLALPAEAIEATRTGISQFAARYGFQEKPLHIRFRVLDPAIFALPGSVCPDVSLDAENFSRLQLAVKRVFITENETNFLAFPAMPEAMVIFGKGYGWAALARGHWLRQCKIHYWGDLDTHGFGILNQLRAHFEHVESFLMDRSTLDAHAAVWGNEDNPLRADLPRLTPEESALYDDLRDNRIRMGVRLEQEHIGFQWVSDCLQRLQDEGGSHECRRHVL
ncbi:hypothetical protein AGMMS50289_13340 [Betaproteobacteria bacterium]|nr:hypothetical protein AGMMS50289_13340 [Betaproteobacteria bacterium]